MYISVTPVTTTATAVKNFIENLGIIAFSRNERTHPNLVSQAREIEIFWTANCRFLQGLWASFSCPSVTSCLPSFVASFVVFDFLGVSLKLTGF